MGSSCPRWDLIRPSGMFGENQLSFMSASHNLHKIATGESTCKCHLQFLDKAFFSKAQQENSKTEIMIKGNMKLFELSICSSIYSMSTFWHWRFTAQHLPTFSIKEKPGLKKPGHIWNTFILKDQTSFNALLLPCTSKPLALKKPPCLTAGSPVILC